MLHGLHRQADEAGVVPNCDPCQIITPLVLVGLGLGVGEGLVLGVGLGLGNHIAISMRGVIIWQGVENGHNTGKMNAIRLMVKCFPSNGFLWEAI